MGFNSQGLMRLYCDNKSAISIVHCPIQHDRAKYIKVDRDFIKEKLHTGHTCIPFEKTEDRLADVFTKSLCNPGFNILLASLICIISIYQLEGECCIS